MVYLGTIWWAAYPGWRTGRKEEGKQGGYIVNFSSPEKFGKTAAEKDVLNQVADFWENECSVTKVKARWNQDEEIRTLSGGHAQIAGTSVGFGVAPDLDRLLQRGIPGLIADVEARRREVAAGGAGDPEFLEGLRIALDVFVDVCRHYERQARGLAAATADAAEHARFEQLAQILSGLPEHAPRTFREAVQLYWLYTLVACMKHMDGWRIDGALGDFYARDLDQGVITEDEAMELLLALWRRFAETGETAVCRLMIGGKGRRNEANADRFALAAMEATRRHRQVTPQLTLRFYEGQNPELLHRAFDVIGETGVYPMLYNDDVVIPGVAQSLGVSETTAQRYHPFGCGEYMLAGCSPSILDSGWSVPKTLEAALHDGMTCDGQPIGPRTGAVTSFATYEDLYAAFQHQVRFAADMAARTYKAVCDTHAKNNAFLFASLLTDDCVARGRALLDGGVRYNGACEMGHGFTNAADSLTAIRKLVFEDKEITLPELVAALDSDFAGREDLRKKLLAAPKFGNDQDEADRILVEMWRFMNTAAKEAGARVGLDFFIISSVNPGGYGMGRQCGASADGRRAGEAFAIGNSPTAGFDKNGITALFNSVAKVDPANGGATTNFKVSREFFNGSRSKLEALFKVYFAKGGMHATITVVNRDDLEAALREPEKYGHVLVRLGGWSARFIDLEPFIQQEILKRTLY